MNLYKAARGIDALDSSALQDSPVHRLHPASKLITTFVYVVLAVSFPSLQVSALVAFVFYPAILMPLSGTPWKPLMTRLAVALPFSFAGGVSNLLINRNIAFYLKSFAVTYGLLSFASIMLKTLFSVLAVLILIATTPFTDISACLTRFRVPKILCLQLLMTYRYISTLLGEAATMLTAYLLRSPKQKGIKMRDMGSFLGQLILLSVARAERVYQAMKCRGFTGVYNSRNSEPFRATDYAYTIGVCMVLLLLRFLNISLLLGGIR
jgi:cobalt/nickel transport system permease protein